MKSAKFAVLFGALSFVFMGCPYESKFPVDEMSAAKVDKSVIGKYEEKGEDSFIWVVSLDGKSYKIEKKKNDGGESTYYEGYLSDISGSLFLNVREKSSDGDGKYYIYKLEKKGEDGERLVLKAMTDNVTEDFTSSAELKSYIKANMGVSYFWNKDDEKKLYKE